jgi:uncharacterized protein (DUF58 family)
MVSADIKRKIREIEIYTRRLVSSTLVGDSRSAQKGSGFDFDQIREYQQGDDVRFIDWKASSRANSLLVKQYTEERSRTIFLLVDVSASSFFSSKDQLKSDILAHVTSVLALIGHYGSDNVSLLLFSDQIECFVPLGKSKNHIHLIMELLFSVKPKSKKTNFDVPFNYIASVASKNATIFVMSDFISNHSFFRLSLLARRYEVVAVRCLDHSEANLPAVGLLVIEDPETKKEYIIHCKSTLNDFLKKRIIDQDMMFKKYGIDCINVTPGQEFIGNLIRFFRKRMRY